MNSLNATSTHGIALFIVLFLVFVVNFMISRMLTATMLRKKFVKQKSEELSKMRMMWLVPIVGALGLFMLLMTYEVLKFWKKANKWLLLKHI